MTDIYKLAERFDALLRKTERPGVERLIEWLHSTDFYEAPASTKYHMSCRGGLLQHSLNVFDALCDLLKVRDADHMDYSVCGAPAVTVPMESVTIMALLHDLCKVNFYSLGYANRKDEFGKWAKVPAYFVEDSKPYGHGEKSVDIIRDFIELTEEEKFAIRWHMGFTDVTNAMTLSRAVDIYPMIWALHSADMLATHVMEDNGGNKAPWEEAAE